jgi:hypothetical protein|tara:strand:+ start:259 stop:480 length:222 start_codon:yes stop_codon:yes gene_type:complete
MNYHFIRYGLETGLRGNAVSQQPAIRQQGFGGHFADAPPPFIKEEDEDNKIERKKKPDPKKKKKRRKKKKSSN